jgi:AraC-like DNA-binding protein
MVIFDLMERIRVFRFRNHYTQGPLFHLTTVDWRRNRLPGLHTHDFCEIFWIVEGACEHLINRAVVKLEVGSVVLMRAEDVHRLRPWRGSFFSFTNLALSPATKTRLFAAYPKAAATLYAPTPLPRHTTLSSSELEQLREETRVLAAAPHERFHLDRFVLNIWSRFMKSFGQPPSGNHLPDWLQEALVRVQEPEVFSNGVPGFIELAGRCHAYVSRECRQRLGKTPTMIVNEARLSRAAKDLRTTSRSITEIALSCGFEDPGRFYHLFRHSFGTTPRRYRRGEKLKALP